MKRHFNGDHAAIKTDGSVLPDFKFTPPAPLMPPPDQLKMIFGRIIIEVPQDQSKIDQQQLQFAIDILSKFKK